MNRARFFGSRLMVAVCLAVAFVTTLLSPAPASAQVMYGTFREDHVFEPPVYLYQIVKEFSANGVAEPKDLYMFFTTRPQGNPFWNGLSQCDGRAMGGPYRSPVDVAAALPAGAHARSPDGTQLVSRPVSPSKPKAKPMQDPSVQSDNVRGGGESASRSGGGSGFNLANIGSILGPLIFLLIVLLALIGGIAALVGKSPKPIQTALKHVNLEEHVTPDDLMRERMRRERERQDRPPPPEWEWVAPGTWRHRGGPPMVYQIPEPGSVLPPPSDRFAPPPGHEPPPAPTHPVWERPEPPPDFGTVVRGPGGVPLQSGPPTTFGQPFVYDEPFPTVLSSIYYLAQQHESNRGDDANVSDGIPQVFLPPQWDLESQGATSEDPQGGDDTLEVDAGAAGDGAAATGGSAPVARAPVDLNEVLVVDTNLDPLDPWPQAATDPALDPPEFNGVSALRKPVPTLIDVPNPPTVTIEQINMDASTAVHSFLDSEGNFDPDAATAWIQVNYQIPPGPVGGTAPPYMNQATYVALKNLQESFLARANAINNFENEPSNPTIPPEAFGVDPDRLQIVPAAEGTVDAINLRPWPPNLHGTGA